MTAKLRSRLGTLLVISLFTLAGVYGLLQGAEGAQQSDSQPSSFTAVAGSIEGLAGLNHDTALVSADTLCRLGYALGGMNALNTFDQGQLASLRSSWYLNFYLNLAPLHNFGMEYAQNVRMHQVKAGPTGIYTTAYVMPYTYTLSLGFSTIASYAEANKGSLWLIGNEIDRRDWHCTGSGDPNACGQDEMLPEVYADAYHDIYWTIKQVDPTARVANAGLVEVTPMRLAYLDKIWNAYQAKYGTKIPVDVWTTHVYILPERFNEYGAETPPGESAPVGIPYLFYQHDDVNIFKQQVSLFRHWMAGKGEQDKPLILSEFGILYPTWVTDEFGNPYSIARVNTYMNGTFDYLFSTASATLGYSLDDNRLVQRWNWVSLDFDPAVINGNLFSPTLGTLSQIGQNWVAYINNPAKPLGPAVNFRALSVSYFLSEGPPSTATVLLKLSNSGSYHWTSPVTVAVKSSDGTLLGQGTFSPAAGCGDISYAYVQAPNLTHTYIGARVEIDPLHQTSDPDFSDNNIAFDLIFLPKHLFLPVVIR